MNGPMDHMTHIEICCLKTSGLAVTFLRIIATFWILLGSRRLDSCSIWPLSDLMLCDGEEELPSVFSTDALLPRVLNFSSKSVKSNKSIILSSSKELNTVPDTCVAGIETQFNIGSLCCVVIFRFPWKSKY